VSMACILLPPSLEFFAQINRDRVHRDQEREQHHDRGDAESQEFCYPHAFSYSSPESNAAMPRNEKNPATSVTVVNTIVED